MKNIFWIASYPKSGNTWMRIFLSNYQREDDKPVDINCLSGGPIASDRSYFDTWSGVKASTLGDDVIENIRPEVYRCMAAKSKAPLFLKVHDAYILTSSGEPLFPTDVTLGAIYIIRNPLDMISSCSNHWGVSKEEAVETLCNENKELADSKGKLNEQLRQRVLSWSGHVRSWLENSGLHVLIVRYEDMKKEPEATFGEVVKFCGFSFNKERLCKAISFSSFEEAKRQEEEKGFEERSPFAKGAFFRNGEAGGWRLELTPAMVKKMLSAHNSVMKRFGYVNDTGQPVQE
ncbi:MAG: sulfotransferase domain-containing protein [Candidatus Riflebacteria bacterium]|nr:sulfotransferase domain-containing protein [Candidatus Riflebacteria bacterium]